MAIPAGIAAAGGALLQGFATSAFNAWQAGKNRSFQERMANTAHQREVEDLKKAGLNPILSARLGGSATPGGAQAQASVPEGAVNSAMQAVNMGSNLALQAAQARQLNADASAKEVAARVSQKTETAQIEMALESLFKLRNDADLSWHMIDKVDEEIKNLRQQLKIMKLEEQHSALDIARARQESDFYKSFGGKVAPWLDHIMRKIGLPPVIMKRYNINRYNTFPRR